MTAQVLTSVKEEVAQFVQTQFPQIAADGVDESTQLLARGLDSLAVLELMTFLSERFGLELEEDDFAEQNFETVGTISTLVARKLA